MERLISLKNQLDRLKNQGWRGIALCAVCLLYLLFPLDIIPDFIPLIGFIDDLAIVTALLLKLHHETSGGDLEQQKSW